MKIWCFDLLKTVLLSIFSHKIHLENSDIFPPSLLLFRWNKLYGPILTSVHLWFPPTWFHFFWKSVKKLHQRLEFHDTFCIFFSLLSTLEGEVVPEISTVLSPTLLFQNQRQFFVKFLRNVRLTPGASQLFLYTFSVMSVLLLCCNVNLIF